MKKIIFLTTTFIYLFLTAGYTQSVNNTKPDSIRLNQVGFYPKAPKTAIVLTDRPQPFSIKNQSGTIVYKGLLKRISTPDLSGRNVFLADFTTLNKIGIYQLFIAKNSNSYFFKISGNVHESVAKGTLKAFYYIRSSQALLPKYAGKWARAEGHPDVAVLVHSSAASVQRPTGTVISSPGGWYDAGDYNKYIVNSGISTATLLSLYEDFPAYTNSVALNIPESGNALPDVLDEVLWNLRWMLTMQDPNDGGVYHKLTNANFDKMIMPDKATTIRYVVQKGTAATLDFAAVMAQASRIFKRYPKQLPGLADSCLKAAVSAWEWAKENPKVIYDQPKMNAKFSPAITTGAYDDKRVDDEFAWAAMELYITTKHDDYLVNVPLYNSVKITIPSWPDVKTLGYYSLLRKRNELTDVGKKAIPQLKQKLLIFADSLANGTTLPAYQTVIGRSTQDYGWGSTSLAANQGIAMIQAYQLSHSVKYINAALSNLDYILGRNGTGYSFITGFGSKTPMHPHHRPSIADGIKEPVPGMMVGGPNPMMQDTIRVPSLIPNRAYIDDQRAYAANEIAINWNAPIAYLANAIEALKVACGYVK